MNAEIEDWSDANGARLVVADTIRFGSFDGVVVILELVSGQYFALDEIASEHWRRLLDHRGDRSAAVAAVESTERRGFEAFIDDCLHRQFLVVDSGLLTEVRALPARRSRHKVDGRAVLTVRAWCSLFVTWVLLRTRG